MIRRIAWMLLALGWVGCGDAGGRLVVDLRTDHVAGEEFVAVRTTLTSSDPTDAEIVESLAVFGTDFVAGQRIAEIADPPSGNLLLRTELISARGSIVATRDTRVAYPGGALAITILMSRDCADVSCPAPESPSLGACYGGRCVSSECTAEQTDGCGDPECEADADCAPSVTCAAGRCVAGSCLFTRDDTACAATAYCDPELGCRTRGEEACELGHWGEPRELTTLNSADTEWGGHITPDRRTVYFSSDRPGGVGGFDIYTSVRASTAEPFPPATIVDSVATADDDENPHLTADGLTLYYDDGTRILRASRTAPGLLFGSSEIVDLGGGAVAPEISNDGSRLFFSATRSDGMGELDLYAATVDGTTFTSIRLLSDLASPDFDCCATEGPDRELVFTSDRTGSNRLYEASWSGADSYGASATFDAIETSGIDASYSDDGRALLYASTSGTSGGWDLFLIERECLP